MVYISSWQEFQEAAEALYMKAPDKARYSVKWRPGKQPGEGQLVLKVTDNSTCLSYKTRSSVYLNRFEAFTLALMQRMQNRRPPSETQALPSVAPAAAKIEGTDQREGTSMPVLKTGAAGAVQVSAPGPGVGIKKKKGKKKKQT